MFKCNLCSETFSSGTLQNLEFFTQHVRDCPLQIDSFFKHRFKCIPCGFVVSTKKSFKQHLLKNHLEEEAVLDVESKGKSSVSQNVRKQKRKEAQRVDDSKLRRLTDLQISLLFPVVGDQSDFYFELNNWKEDPTGYIERTSPEQIEETSAICLDFDDEHFNLEYVLKKYPDSLLLLKEYRTGYERPLNDEERVLLCRTIVFWMLRKGIVLRRIDFLCIFYKIKSIFQKEICKLYYVPAETKSQKKICKIQKAKSSKHEKKQATTINDEDQVENKKQGLQIKVNGPSGLLFNTWRTLIQKSRREAKKRGHSTKSLYRNVPKASDDNEPYLNTDMNKVELLDIKGWLATHFDPPDTIKAKWALTCEMRMDDIFLHEIPFSELLAEWPRYQKQWGYELVEIDFEYLHRGVSNNLRKLWPQYATKMIELAKTKAKKKNKKGEDDLRKLSMLPPGNDEEQNFIHTTALYAAFYMCPGQNNIVKQDLEKMFRNLQLGKRIVDEVYRISEEQASKGKGKEVFLNPYILYYNSDNGIPYKFFVVIDTLFYEVGNVITALDILFKAYFVFNLNYPPECKYLLQFIQHFVYEIKYEKDFTADVNNRFMFAIDAERTQKL
ncbi:hypothetical protein ACFFRR_006992 [Megaselia abdita]